MMGVWIDGNDIHDIPKEVGELASLRCPPLLPWEWTMPRALWRPCGGVLLHMNEASL